MTSHSEDARTKDERVELTPEQAIAMLPDGEYVHTFYDLGGTLFGADHGRRSIERSIRDAEKRELAGEAATRMRHGLVLHPKGAKWHSELLFVETRESV